MGSYWEAVHLTGFYSPGRTIGERHPSSTQPRFSRYPVYLTAPVGATPTSSLNQHPPRCGFGLIKLHRTKLSPGNRRPPSGGSCRLSTPRKQGRCELLDVSSRCELDLHFPISLPMWNPSRLRYGTCGFLRHRPLTITPASRAIALMTSATYKPVMGKILANNHLCKGVFRAQGKNWRRNSIRHRTWRT